RFQVERHAQFGAPGNSPCDGTGTLGGWLRIHPATSASAARQATSLRSACPYWRKNRPRATVTDASTVPSTTRPASSSIRVVPRRDELENVFHLRFIFHHGDLPTQPRNQQPLILPRADQMQRI